MSGISEEVDVEVFSEVVGMLGKNTRANNDNKLSFERSVNAPDMVILLQSKTMFRRTGDFCPILIEGMVTKNDYDCVTRASESGKVNLSAAFSCVRDFNMKSKRPTAAQLKYLSLGRSQPGGKLPLFDKNGQQISAATIRSCIRSGWVEPWFNNPIKPDWLVCKLTEAGQALCDGKSKRRAKAGL